MTETQKIKELKLHEFLDLDGETSVMRVPGGLIYYSYWQVKKGKSCTMSSCFVPFTDFIF